MSTIPDCVLPLNWFGPSDIETTVGLHCQYLCGELNQMGIDVTFVPTDAVSNLAPSLASAFQRSGYLNINNPAIRLGSCTPSELAQFFGSRRIPYVAYCGDLVPKASVAALNTCDGVMVPSTTIRELLMRCGLEKPCRVVPGGVDHSVFNRTVSPSSDHPRSRSFRFLCVGEWNSGDGVVREIRAFVQAFSKEEDVELLVLLTGVQPDPGELATEIVRLELGPHPPIRIAFGRRASEASLAGILRASDAFLQLSKEDPFSFDVLRAMACGVPVIATAGVEESELCTAETCWLIHRKDGVDSQKEWEMNTTDGEGASLGPLAETMRACWSDRTKNLTIIENAWQASQKRSWRKVAATVMDAVAAFASTY